MTVLETFPLGAAGNPAPWPTLDPFLFCVHHHDEYPSGTAQLGPAATLAGRAIGQDFSNQDGWSMYHGQIVPGFPSHPHRGFETITYVRRGLVDHCDSMGAAARYGRGDVQWLTAGGGIVHAEMFPLLDRDSPNPAELFQIWLNLPRADKMVDPHFTMFWDHQVPRVVSKDVEGRRTEVTVVAGILDRQLPPSPPPQSYASRQDADVAIWHIQIEADARWTLPPASSDDANRVLYLFDGQGLAVDETVLNARTGAGIDARAAVELHATDGDVECLILQGRPIGEPVEQYGPFVMNDRAGIAKAYEDYQRTGFGGWPWETPDPNHGPTRGRFARHADGREDAPSE